MESWNAVCTSWKKWFLVSRICLGTMNFGEYTSEAESFKIMDKALELGVNFFDTANIYGGNLARYYRKHCRQMAGTK